MKLNETLFAVKQRTEVKSESLVDYLYSIYEQNFKIIDQMLFSSLEYQTRFKYLHEIPKNLLLSSRPHAPDIHVEVSFLSSYTADVKMHYRDSEVDNIRYFYYVEFRLFLDAKILEVKETGFLRSCDNKIKKSEKEVVKKYNKSTSIQDKLTKSLLVQEWFNELVKLKYTLNETE
jgi:hypothetical protein